MPGQGRLGDKANIAGDAHGCPGCPHPGVGPAISGSPNVLVNGRPALRVDDVGIHAVCCGPNMWSAQRGSATVFINGKAAFRQNDQTRHCGGQGTLIDGSTDVIVGDASGGGSGAGGGSGGGGNGNSAPGGSARASAANSSSPATMGAAGDVPSGSSDAAASAADRSPSTGPADPAPASAARDPADPLEDQLEVQVLSGTGGPRAQLVYEVVLPDGTKLVGQTAADGFIRHSFLGQRGECTLRFPDIDNEMDQP